MYDEADLEFGIRWRVQRMLKIFALIAATIVCLSFCATRVCAEEKYVGLTLCSPELQSSRPDLKVGLDLMRHAYVVYRELPRARVVMIVVYADQNDQCGSVRDAREFRNSRDVFAGNCTDILHVEKVVVGLFDQKFDPEHPIRQLMRGPAVQSWEIDLKNFRFLWKSASWIICQIDTGSDNGDDLASLAHQRQRAAAGVGRQKIIVRMLNGKNGKPVRNENPNLWIGSLGNLAGLRGSHLGFTTDSKGEFVLDVTDAQPRELRISPDYFVDCRYAGDQTGGDKIRYSLEEIIRKGVVGDNRCGTPHVQPAPGILVLYARPRTWREKRDL